MKKRLFSLALTLALCLGLAVPAFAADASGLDANGAKAYLEVLNQQVTAHGVITDSFGPSGIMYTALEDMNADGTPELIILTGKQGDGGDILVWTLRNGKAVQTVNGINEIDPSGNIIFTFVSLARKPGETAVCTRVAVRQYHEDGSSGLYTEEYRIYHFDGRKETFTDENFDAAWRLDNEEFSGDGLNAWYGDKGASTRAVQSALTAKAASVPSGGFTDVKAGAYYADAVKWAVDRKITSGTSATTFSPNKTCSVAEILTFLWRANGSPKQTGSSPFSDISASNYYYDAALWAYGKGLVSGNKFNPNAPCTRAMVVEYLWKLEGSPVSNVPSGYSTQIISGNYDGQPCNIRFSAATMKEVTIIEKAAIIGETGLWDDIVGFQDVPRKVTLITAQAGSTFTFNGLSSTVWYGYHEKNGTYQEQIEQYCEPIYPGNVENVYQPPFEDASAFVLGNFLDKNGNSYLLKIVSAPTDFSDVPSSAAYAQAVAWAVEQKITAGTSATTFSPAKTCTRGDIVTFLYRAMG